LSASAIGSLSGVITDPADPAMWGSGLSLWGSKIMALIFFTENLTQQFYSGCECELTELP